jgi:hypothetical protein
MEAHILSDAYGMRPAFGILERYGYEKYAVASLTEDPREVDILGV